MAGSIGKMLPENYHRCEEGTKDSVECRLDWRSSTSCCAFVFQLLIVIFGHLNIKWGLFDIVSHYYIFYTVFLDVFRSFLHIFICNFQWPVVNKLLCAILELYNVEYLILRSVDSGIINRIICFRC